ncbi:unnamed protein product [Meganyctiphanes norvegica]|uniref:Uncharacterized protein n=1 Tax=Meganyctiphanes norvegica TaxID=48144 RepID=A0AAV2PVC4_MEGNR
MRLCFLILAMVGVQLVAPNCSDNDNGKKTFYYQSSNNRTWASLYNSWMQHLDFGEKIVEYTCPPNEDVEHWYRCHCMEADPLTTPTLPAVSSIESSFEYIVLDSTAN